MIKVGIDKNGAILTRTKLSKYKNDTIILDWKNVISKRCKEGRYYYADYVRLVNDIPLKDKRYLNKIERSICKL